jgi:TonB family protein
MTLDLFTRNFIALVLQASAVGAIGALLPVLLRVRAPRPLLYYWHALLGVILLLPSLQFLAPAVRTKASSPPLLHFTATAARQAGAWPPGRMVALAIGAVALLRLAWLAAGILALHRYRNRAEPVAGFPAVAVSQDISGPVSFGIWRPVILLPESWRSMSAEVQTAVVCHEAMHIRRHDWAVHMAEEIIRSVLWFQPAIWYIVAEIRMVREQVVDLEVVHHTRAREAYIEALLTAADGGSTFGLPAPCFVRKHQLVERIRKITKEYRMSKRRIAVSFAGFALVLLAGGTVAVSSFPLQAEQPGKSGKVYKMEDGITPPRLVEKVEPGYSEEARAARVEGTVLLRVEITAEGAAQNIQVMQGIGSGLNEKAVEAVQQWHFAPGTKDGEPVTVLATIEVNFRLK